MPAQRRTIRDVSAIAIFLIVVAILFWPGGDNGPESDAAPDGDALESETPVAEATPTVPPESACDVEDSIDVVHQFVRALNDGEPDEIRSLIPSEGTRSDSAAVHPGMDQSILHRLRVHESGEFAEPDQVIDHFAARHAAGEVWEVTDIHGHRIHRGTDAEGPELDQLSVIVRRNADDLPGHELEGDIVVNCEDGTIIHLDLETHDPVLALPLPVEDFLSAVGPYGTAEMRDLRMIVSTDLREDWGSLRAWDIHRIEANSTSGTYVERVTISTPAGEPVIDYRYDGLRWYLDQRGWREVGDITGWSVLPLEIMITREEPSTTARIIRDNIDEIPEDGRVTLTGDFEVREDLRTAAAVIPRAEAVDGLIEVEIEDGNLTRTRYRLVDRQMGVHSNTPEIQWISIHRRTRFDASIFSRPAGFERDEQQYHPPDNLSADFELIERLYPDDRIGERFSLDWNDGAAILTVQPSRGISSETTRGDDWPLTWATRRSIAGGIPVVMAGPEQGVFPISTVWDTGSYRFDLRVEPDSPGVSDRWDESAAIEIVEALLATDE